MGWQLFVNVLHVPELKVNFFSCDTCLEKGIRLMTDSNSCTFKRGNRIVAVGIRENKLFSMMIKIRIFQGTEQVNIAIKVFTLQQWHEKLGHQSVQYVRNFLKHMRIPYMNTENEFFCKTCIYGK